MNLKRNRTTLIIILFLIKISLIYSQNDTILLSFEHNQKIKKIKGNYDFILVADNDTISLIKKENYIITSKNISISKEVTVFFKYKKFDVKGVFETNGIGIYKFVFGKDRTLRKRIDFSSGFENKRAGVAYIKYIYVPSLSKAIIFPVKYW